MKLFSVWCLIAHIFCCFDQLEHVRTNLSNSSPLDDEGLLVDSFELSEQESNKFCNEQSEIFAREGSVSYGAGEFTICIKENELWINSASRTSSTNSVCGTFYVWNTHEINYWLRRQGLSPPFPNKLRQVELPVAQQLFRGIMTV